MTSRGSSGRSARVVGGSRRPSGPTVGYRIETGTASFAYLPDHEPALAGPFAERPTDWISGASVAEGRRHAHDAQYSEDEYEERIGWGHSSVADAVAFARRPGASPPALHHEPAHADGLLEDLEARAQSLMGEDEISPTLAREGMVVELP